MSEEGECMGLVEGNVVIRSPDIEEVISTLEKYSDKEVTLSSSPASDRILIL